MASRLHDRYRVRFERLRGLLTSQVLAYPQADLDAWLAQTVPAVLDTQRAVVGLTDAYLSLEAGLATGTDTTTWGLDPDELVGAKARRDVPLEDVYARTLRATGGTVEQRLTRELATDVQLAHRQAAFVHTEGDPRINGYRRALSAARKNCALCVAAATRVYRSSDLQPIHSHCGCTVQPVYRDAPAPQVDKAFLDRLYRLAGSTEYGDLRVVKVPESEIPAGLFRVQDTPELGPTLTT